MRDTEIIEALCSKLSLPGGRHLYGVLGVYPQLKAFAKKLQQARTSTDESFPKPLSVNRGISTRSLTTSSENWLKTRRRGLSRQRHM